MNTVISVSNLIKKYKKSTKNAVDGVSFEVEEGEFFAFLGPNGAGKTTTISILTTILSKTSGEAKIAGFDVNTQAAQVRSKIGIIFQNPSLDLNLTAEENIRFHAVLYGVYPFRPSFKLMPKAYQDKVQELAEILGIKDSINNPVKTFSGGMKRKLEIVRSLIHNPQILFLDEPTTGLDPASRKSLWKYLMEVKSQNNTTIFLTTHYLEEAEDADRLAIINHGKIVSSGAPTKIKHDIVKDYVILNSKDSGVLRAELTKKDIEFELESKNFKVPLAGNGEHAQKLIKQVDTKLNVLEIHTPTLEEAYLEIIEQTNNHETGN